MKTRRLATSAAVASVLALGLAGCIKMDMQLELQPDDTVDGSMVFAVSSALVEMSGQDPQDMVDEMQQDILDSDQDMRTEPYDDGEFVGTTTYFDGAALDTFGAGDEESMQIVREGDEFVVTGVMDMTEAAGGEDLGMAAGMMEGMDIRIAVTFPGAVADHNGTLEGNTVSWEPTVGERLEMNARGSAVAGGGSSSLPLPLLIGGGVLALLVIGGVLFAVLRNRSSEPAPAAAVPSDSPAPEFIPQPDAAQPAPPAPPAAPPAPPAPQADAPPPPPAPGGEEKPPTA